MRNCTFIDPLVTPYVDGELSATERTFVDDHLNECPPCCARVAAEGAVRDLVRARKAGLTTERASESLRSQCRDLAAQNVARSPLSGVPASSPPPVRAARAGWRIPWRAGWAPLALTASLVLVVAGAFLYQATHHSARLLAAELAADHMKCFAANTLLGTHHAPAVVERSMMSAFGWQLHLPEQFDASGLELVGSRRCLYAEGKVAHLMYRDHGRPVSIFMLPKRVRAEELVEALGHEAAIWSSGDRTFVLVTRGSRAEVQRMASLVKAALQ
jgi:anti-sigma factor RsiW